MNELSPGALTRRSLLKRGAVVGGAGIWVVPAVQALSMTRASADTPSGNGVDPITIHKHHAGSGSGSSSGSGTSGSGVDSSSLGPQGGLVSNGGLASTGTAFPVIDSVAIGAGAIALGVGALAAGKRRPSPSPLPIDPEPAE